MKTLSSKILEETKLSLEYFKKDFIKPKTKLEKEEGRS